MQNMICNVECSMFYDSIEIGIGIGIWIGNANAIYMFQCSMIEYELRIG
jgi:hypothetical protein